LDWRQLERWRIPEARVPPGTTLLFRSVAAPNGDARYLGMGLLVFAGQLALIIGLVVERAWRRRAEREARQTRESLAHLTRVSAMGELAASLAHELNQPLTGILGNARAAGHLLSRGDLPVPLLKDIIRDIVEDDKRAADVIGRIRELSRKRATERVPLDVNDVIRDAIKLVNSNSIIRNVSVGLNLTPNAIVVEGDRIQLQQVVLNLLLNGLEAAATSGVGPHTVVVSTSLSDRHTAHIVVRDSGGGLPPGIENRVFDPFFTTKEAGMGMGLSIARSIVESHRGRIWASNSPDRGAEFHFTLPRLAAGASRLWIARPSA
jgi:signal transduction histidine kinase